MIRKTKLEVHKLIYKELCIRSNKILMQCKIDYYSSKITDIGNDHKKLFKLTNSLLGNNNEVALPSQHSSVSGPYRPITPYVKPFFTPQLCSQP
jgi:hypothetical protein